MSTIDFEKAKQEYLRKEITQLWNEKGVYSHKANKMASMDIKSFPIICEKIRREIDVNINPNIVISSSFDRQSASHYLKITDLNGNGLMIDFSRVLYLGQINAGFYYILRRFDIDSLINYINSVFLNLPKWLEELDSIAHRVNKIEKIRSIAEKNIELWIDDLMMEHNFTYLIRKEKEKSVLCVRFKYKKMLEIPIFHKNYQQTLPNLIETIKLFLKASEESPLFVHIKTYGNNINWKKGKKEWG